MLSVKCEHVYWSLVNKNRTVRIIRNFDKTILVLGRNSNKRVSLGFTMSETHPV